MLLDSLRVPDIAFFFWGVLLSRLREFGGTAGTYGAEGEAKVHDHA